MVLAAGHGKAGGAGWTRATGCRTRSLAEGRSFLLTTGADRVTPECAGGAGHWVWVDWVGSCGGSTWRRAFHAFRGRSWARPRCESHFWLWAGAHMTISMRYRYSTALEGGVTGGSVAGALISNNGAPWWTTFGDGGGRNNCCVRKISVSALGRVSGVFHKNNIIICCQSIVLRGITYVVFQIKKIL